MKVVVDRGLCSGHGRCFAVAPEFYALDADGYSAFAGEVEVPIGSEDAARKGANNCPEMAIVVVDEHSA
jgi:ferredoxin